MYVLFEQRERGQEGTQFVDSAWERFYSDLDRVFAPAPRSYDGDGDRTVEAGEAADLDDADYDSVVEEPGAA